jgi:hypothetical protein
MCSRAHPLRQYLEASKNYDAPFYIFNFLRYLVIYSFVNRTKHVWNQLPADVLGTLSCKPSNFRKRARKVINKVK